MPGSMLQIKHQPCFWALPQQQEYPLLCSRQWSAQQRRMCRGTLPRRCSHQLHTTLTPALSTYHEGVPAHAAHHLPFRSLNTAIQLSAKNPAAFHGLPGAVAFPRYRPAMTFAAAGAAAGGFAATASLLDPAAVSAAAAASFKLLFLCAVVAWMSHR